MRGNNNNVRWEIGDTSMKSVLKRCGLLVVTGGVLLGTVLPAATVGAQQYNLSNSGVWEYKTEIFSDNRQLCGIEEYLVTVNPSLELTESAQLAINRLQAKVDELIDTIARITNIKKEIISEKIIPAIGDILISKAGDIDAAIEDFLTNDLPGIVKNLMSSLYMQDAISEAEKQYQDLFDKATQDQQTWQDKVDDYEAPGGVVSQVTAATNSFNTIINNNTYVRGLFALLNVPDPVTNEWMIKNVSSVANIINGVDCSNWLVSLAGATAACNTVKTEVKTISDNLSDYQDYKDLLADPATDPEAWAINKMGCDSSFSSEQCILSVAEENANNKAANQVDTYLIPILSRVNITIFQDIARNAINEIAKCFDITTEKAGELLGAIFGWLYNKDTRVDLTYSTFINRQRVGGERVYNLSLREIVQLLTGEMELDSYTISIPASAFDEDGNVILNNRIGLRFGRHNFALLGRNVVTVAKICRTETPISPIVDDEISTPITGVKSVKKTNDNSLILVGLFSVVLLASVGVIRFSTSKR